MSKIVAFNDTSDKIFSTLSDDINIIKDDSKIFHINSEYEFRNLDKGFAPNTWPCRGSPDCTFFDNVPNKLNNSKWQSWVFIDILSLPPS
jgi:hypothetical protein